MLVKQKLEVNKKVKLKKKILTGENIVPNTTVKIIFTLQDKIASCDRHKS